MHHDTLALAHLYARIADDRSFEQFHRVLAPHCRISGPGYAMDGLPAILQGMEVLTTATTPGGSAVGASDPIYMVLSKNTSFADAYAIAATFAASQGIPLNQIQSVPEPGSLALAGGAAFAAAAGLRRRIGRRSLTAS